MTGGLVLRDGREVEVVVLGVDHRCFVAFGEHLIWNMCLAESVTPIIP